jgi:hypothetical protein
MSRPISWPESTSTKTTSVDGDPAGSSVLVPNQLHFTRIDWQQKRSALSGALQWAPSDKWLLTLAAFQAKANPHRGTSHKNSLRRRVSRPVEASGRPNGYEKRYRLDVRVFAASRSDSDRGRPRLGSKLQPHPQRLVLICLRQCVPPVEPGLPRLRKARDHPLAPAAVAR